MIRPRPSRHAFLFADFEDRGSRFAPFDQPPPLAATQTARPPVTSTYTPAAGFDRSTTRPFPVRGCEIEQRRCRFRCVWSATSLGEIVHQISSAALVRALKILLSATVIASACVNAGPMVLQTDTGDREIYSGSYSLFILQSSFQSPPWDVFQGTEDQANNHPRTWPSWATSALLSTFS